MQRKHTSDMPIVQLPQLVFRLYINIKELGFLPFAALLGVLSGPLAELGVPMMFILFASFSYTEEVGLVMKLLL